MPLLLKLLLSVISAILIFKLESDKKIIENLLVFINKKFSLGWKEKTRKSIHKYSLVTITSILLVITNDIINYLEFCLDRPKVKVTCQKKSENKILIKIEKNSTYLRNLRISVPIFGKILKIEDLSDIKDANTVRKQVSGYQNELCRNDAELLIEDVTSVKELSYMITYQPVSEERKIFLMNTFRSWPNLSNTQRKAETLEDMLNMNTISYSYSWYSDGRDYSENKWISKKTNSFIEDPNDRLREICFDTDLKAAAEILKSLKPIHPM